MRYGSRLLPALIATVLTGVLFFAGCGDSITTPASDLSDEETLREFVDDHEFFDERGLPFQTTR